MPTGLISVNELKNVFFSIKTNKCPGHDEINFNVIRSCFGKLCEPLQYLFNLSFEKSIFPDDLRLAKVTPVFKAKYLLDSNILYKKLFGFQEGHSTDHAFLELVDQIDNNLEQNKFTSRVFIDLSKALDTVDHSIL